MVGAEGRTDIFTRRKIAPRPLVFFVLPAFFWLTAFTAYGANQNSFPLSQAGSEAREYLPGDVVHIVIEAPIDTRRVSAVMPDKQEVYLTYDGRINVWHGYWEVPAGFKKGSYSAKLIATDLEGGVFEGQSSNFYIGEPALALIVKLSPTREPELPKPPAEVKEARPIVKPIVKRIAKPKVARKRVAAVLPKVNSSAAKARYVVAARSYMSTFEYERAKKELSSLIKIDPDNATAKRILSRLEVVIRAKEKKQ